MKYSAVALGVSAGGLEALSTLLSAFPATFALPILLVQHLHPKAPLLLPDILNAKTALKVDFANDKESIIAGHVYIAPPNYHMLVEMDLSIALNVDRRVNYARPAVDVLFETASEAYGDTLIAIVLTGANNDGAKGMSLVKRRGGLTIVQDPNEAKVPQMPMAAIYEADPHHILPLKAIPPLILEQTTHRGDV